jgi:hypothetical protein
LELAGLAGVVPVYIGGVFLPHLDGFCHLSQDNPNKYLLALGGCPTTSQGHKQFRCCQEHFKFAKKSI